MFDLKNAQLVYLRDHLKLKIAGNLTLFLNVFWLTVYFFLDFHIEREQDKMQSKMKSFFQRGTVMRLIIFKNMTSDVDNFERLKY